MPNAKKDHSIAKPEVLEGIFYRPILVFNQENNVEEDNEGGIGAVDALVAPEGWALDAEAEAEEPFRFFDDSAIWRSVCRF